MLCFNWKNIIKPLYFYVIERHSSHKLLLHHQVHKLYLCIGRVKSCCCWWSSRTSWGWWWRRKGGTGPLLAKDRGVIPPSWSPGTSEWPPSVLWTVWNVPETSGKKSCIGVMCDMHTVSKNFWWLWWHSTYLQKGWNTSKSKKKEFLQEISHLY